MCVLSRPLTIEDYRIIYPSLHIFRMNGNICYIINGDIKILTREKELSID